MSTHRLPESSDFPSGLAYTLKTPAKAAQNILILFHGLGDTHEPFAALGTNLNLPETACLAIKGPTPLPFDITGFHWGDDIIFDQSTGGLDGDSGFKRTRKLLREVVDESLVKKCGWNPRSIFFLGFGQGGMVAVDIPAGNKSIEYGGAISIGGALPSDVEKLEAGGLKSATPVLLLGAEKNSVIDKAAEEKMKQRFDFVKVVKWGGRDGDGMMKSREEARPIMEFFAKRLRSMQGVPEGAVELTL
ncbi:Phospholipase/Carboxylesterase-domain-containing protein [Morchella snyderi]|nr:Phospholipase/Carboxylesterase-domain-containing protein [Morchella snyderi]